MTHTINTQRWTILFSIVVGLMLAILSDIATPWGLGVYDKYSPVVTMHGKLVSQTENNIIIHITGDKHRFCRYITTQAFAVVDTVMRDVNMERIDVVNSGGSKPLGKFDVGLWKIWPIVGARSVAVYVQHDCDGRVVVTKITEVVL